MENYFNSGLLAGLLGVGFIFVILFSIIFVALVVFNIVGKWKLYEKAGRKGWESIVPFYNDWVYVEMAGLNSWYFLFLIAGSLSVVFNIDDNISIYNGTFRIIALAGLFFCNYNISKKLHKDTVFAVLMTLFSFIIIPLIGFSDKYVWDDSVPVSVNGPFDDVNNNNNNKENNSNNNNEKDFKYCGHCGAKIESNSKYCSNCGKEI